MEENNQIPEPETITPDQQSETSQSETAPPQSDVQREESTATPEVSEKKPHSKRKKLLIVGLLVALLAVGAGVYWWKFRPKEKSATPVTQQPAKPEKKVVTKTEEEIALEKLANPTTGETWLAKQKQLPLQGYLQNEDKESTVYNEVGARAGNTIIMATVMVLGQQSYLFEKSADGTVRFIVSPNGAVKSSAPEDVTTLFTKKVTLDSATHYDSLSIPQKLDVGNNNSVALPKNTYLGGDVYPDTDKTVSKTVVKQYGKSTLYKRERTDSSTNLTSVSYGFVTPLNTEVTMDYAPVETTLNNYTWTTGDKTVTDSMSAITRGCGGATASVTRSDVLNDSELTQVGTSPSGKKVYEIKDSNNVLVTKAYTEFIDFYKGTGEEQNISKATFISRHGLILFKDANNQWLVYARDKLRPVGGCAKPVVYLYPTQSQYVDVKVGAHVKVSDPLYDPISGWQHVLAQPNGQLRVNGQNYGSLFWEGPGYGEYPAITTGTIVPTARALDTIQAQLMQLGLNETEISDFVSYWQDKMPTQPYTRLTWLNTEQMNRVAPLSISPKPDTLIRVFLDYEGLERPTPILPQQLTSIPRNGFTVVEWGGLSPHPLW